MRFIVRAAGLAAAALSLSAATGSNPVGATVGQTDLSVSPIVHETAATPALDIGLNDLPQPAQRAELEEVSSQAAIVRPAILTEEPDQERAPERRSLSELVREYSANDVADEQAECLARAVYFESKGEPLAGQLSVADVIVNRARSGRFAGTICGVVRQPSQFSFVRRGVIPTPPQNAQWRTAVAIARIAMQDLADGSAPRALFFHARHVSPRWRNVTRVATVGNHVFYR